MSADPYLAWCRDARLPRELRYGDRWQTWYEGSIYSPPREGWDSDGPEVWSPWRQSSIRKLPMDGRPRCGVIAVWVPAEADWLDRLTAAGYSVRFNRGFEGVFVAEAMRSGSAVSAHADSWAHALALCWQRTDEGKAHFAGLGGG